MQDLSLSSVNGKVGDSDGTILMSKVEIYNPTSLFISAFAA